jgi:predicted amino acid dehydrogenase
MLEVPVPVAYRKIIQTGRLAERLGAQILGLGAFTSVVGDSGITVSKHLAIPVTTGNSYTIAVAVEATLVAAVRMGLDPARCTGAVVGAYGSTGQACAQLLARSVPHMVLIGRDHERLAKVQCLVEGAGAQTTITSQLDAVRQADMVLTVTSSIEPIIEAEHLKPGAVVCDVARPRNVSRQVVEERDDVLVIEGGIVEVPGNVDFGFDFGFPPGKAYACMAETAILALEGRYECYTIGREISMDQVNEIAQLGAKHGFYVSGLRSFEQPVHVEQIERVRRNVQYRTRRN